MIDAILKNFEEKAGKSINFFKQSLARTRTGRAQVSLLDNIKVAYYGQQTPLKQLGNITTPDPKQIVIQPWDPSALADIEKEILKANLGLTPLNDGKIIRINIPSLTEERRKELVKITKNMTEECKVQLRHSRREVNDSIKKLEQDKKISTDDSRKFQEN